MMHRFVKGLLLGILFICSIGLLWFLVIQPFLTQKDAEDLKAQYIVTAPQLNLQRVNRMAGRSTNWILHPCVLAIRMFMGGLPSPEPAWTIRWCKAMRMILNITFGGIMMDGGEWPEVCSSSMTVTPKARMS